MIDYNSQEFQQLISERKKQHLTSQQREENIIEWNQFYKNNIDIWANDFLEIPLFQYQKNMLIEIQENDITTLICSRGSAKSFITAIASLFFTLMRSNCTVLVVSLTLNQSNLLISQKIDKELSNPKTGLSPVLRQLRQDGWMEIKKDQNTGGYVVEFGNGSVIKSGALSESLRGNRSQVVILDEAAICSKSLYQQVAEPTLTQRIFKGRPQDYNEGVKQIMLSSCRNKQNWLYRFLVNVVNGHYNKNSRTKYGFFAIDVLGATVAGIQSPEQYYQRKKNTDDLTFQQEYLNVWLGENENSLFKLEDFEKNQVLENPFYPRTLDDILSGKENSYNYSDDWVRILASDIALSGGNEDDASCFILGAMNRSTGERRIEYLIPRQGLNTLTQVIEMKRLFYEYQADYCIQDTKGVGGGVFDLLTTETYDSMYGKTYPAWTVCRDSDLQITSDTVMSDKIKRTISDDAKEVLIPFVGTSELNSIGHLSFRKALKDGYISFLKDDGIMQPLIEDKDPTFVTKSAEEKAEILMPYVQTRIMINEAVSLEMKMTETGLVKLQEASRTLRKDMYMTAMMFNFLCDKLLLKYQKDTESDWTVDDWAWLAG